MYNENFLALVDHAANTKNIDIGLAWQQPNQSSYDFRSDTITNPSMGVLRAIVQAGFSDGWAGGGDTKILEDDIASRVGKSSSMFMVSSTMANQVSIWAHLGTAPGGVLCDTRSHILHMEGGSVAMLSRALPQPVTPSNGLYMTVEDIKRRVVLMDGAKLASISDCPTRIIHLENPLGGNIMPLEEMKRIKRFAEEHNIKVHLDGARLWDAAAAGAGTLASFSACADSVNLCATKGIGGSVGSILSGDVDFMIRVKGINKSMGGAMRQPGFLAAAASAAINESFGGGISGKGSVFRRSHEAARRLAEYWKKIGGSVLVPQETNMLWLDLEALGIKETAWVEGGKEFGVLLNSCRIVTHYQLSDEAICNVERYMSHAMLNLTNMADVEFPQNECVSRLAACMQDVYQQRRTA